MKLPQTLGSWVGVLLGAVLLGACVTPSKIASNKADSYSKEPRRLFIITDIGSEFGNDFFGSFERRITSIAQDCGAVLQISRLSNLELDQNVHANRLKTFGADTLLTIRRNGGTRNEYGLYHVVYDARLVDVQSNKLVWRADTNFYRGSMLTPIAERGEALAVDLTNRLKEDQVFRGCAVIKPKA